MGGEVTYTPLFSLWFLGGGTEGEKKKGRDKGKKRKREEERKRSREGTGGAPRRHRGRDHFHSLMGIPTKSQTSFLRVPKPPRQLPIFLLLASQALCVPILHNWDGNKNSPNPWPCPFLPRISHIYSNLSVKFLKSQGYRCWQGLFLTW